jgi:hypothetical protein
MKVDPDFIDPDFVGGKGDDLLDDRFEQGLPKDGKKRLGDVIGYGLQTFPIPGGEYKTIKAVTHR